MGKIKNFRIAVFCAGLFLLPPAMLSAAEADAAVLQRDTETNKLNFADVRENKPEEALAASASSSSLRVIGLGLLLLGAAAGAITLFYKRRYSPGRSGQKGQQLAVLERLSVGPQRELLLIKACDRLLVVGCQGNQLSLLSDLPAEDSPSLPFNSLMSNAGSAGFQPASGAAFQTVNEHVQDVRATGVSAAAAAWPAELGKIKMSRATPAHTPLSVSAAYAWPEAENAK